MKLSKFGGVCMANAEYIKKSANIIRQNNKRKIVVVSAPGQRNSNDIKITDRLYACYDEIIKFGHCDESYKEIEKHFLDITNAFNLTKYNNILKNIKLEIENSKKVDFIVSRGEFLMAQIFADILNFEFIDAGKIIKFNKNNELDEKLTFNLTKKFVSKTKKGVVIPGFYGKNPAGEIITFTRDGTDFTASLVATACDVSVYENWKDVEGIFTGNPSIIEKPKKVSEISYSELRKLSYLGAKVVHPSTVLPVSEKNIPIEIRSFLDSSLKGTKITNKKSSKISIKAITAKSNLVLIYLKKEMHHDETKFLSNILDFLQEHTISLSLFKVDIDNIYIVISSADYFNHEKLLLNKLKSLQLKEWEVEDIALISIVGNDICRKPRLINDIYNTLQNNYIDIKFIKLDGENSFVCVAVNNKEEKLTLTSLYEKLFSS